MYLLRLTDVPNLKSIFTRSKGKKGDPKSKTGWFWVVMGLLEVMIEMVPFDG